MELPAPYTVSNRDLARRRNLRAAAWASPLALGGIPAVLMLAALALFSLSPPTAAVVLFIGLLLTALGFLTGLGLSAYFYHRRNEFTKELKERIAADGISASELDWFKKELTHAERRTLKTMEGRDPLLADSYRDALASRLTASRIVRSSNQELQLMRRREAKLRQLKSAPQLRKELEADVRKIQAVAGEAKALLAEAQSRLQMIEAASVRSGTITDSELALKKLSMRTRELPAELEHAKLTDEIRQELEKEGKGEEKTEKPFGRMN
jgi:hypothetical protein